MAASALFALLLANAATAAAGKENRTAGGPRGPTDLSNFDTGCYYKEDPAQETGGGKGKSYRGLMAHTISGRSCKRWTEVGKKLSFNPIADQTDGGKTKWGNGVGHHNYCRNPDQSQEQPWCYTMDPNPDHAKEICSIPECPKQSRDFIAEAKRMSEKVAGGLFCKCAKQLYGSTTTTKDTYVPLAMLSEDEHGMGLGEPCACPAGSRGVIARK